MVLDRASGELVQRSTAYAYGEVESSLRPSKWESFREDYRFTGKEDDVEVGLIYFGKRFYAPLLQRWISPDPLAIHAPGTADLNLYAYVHGRALVAVDPVGLQSADEPDAGAPCGGTESPDASASSSDVSNTTDYDTEFRLATFDELMNGMSLLSSTGWLDYAYSDAQTRPDAGVGPTESPPGGTDYSAGVEGGLLADPAMRWATWVAIDFLIGGAVSEVLLGRGAVKSGPPSSKPGNSGAVDVHPVSPVRAQTIPAQTASGGGPGSFSSSDVAFGVARPNGRPGGLVAFAGEATPGTRAPLSESTSMMAPGTAKNSAIARETAAFAKQTIQQTNGQLRFNLDGFDAAQALSPGSPNYGSVTSAEFRAVVNDSFLRANTKFYRGEQDVTAEILGAAP